MLSIHSQCNLKAKIVAGRLCQIQSFDSAGQLLQQINLFQEAVRTYCEGKSFQASRNCARMIQNGQLNENLINILILSKDKIQNQIKIHGLQLIKVIMQLFVKFLNKLEIGKIAHQKSSELLKKYLNNYIKLTVQGAKFAEADQIYVDYGMQLIPKNYPDFL